MDTSEGRPAQPVETPSDRQSLLAARLARMRLEARSRTTPQPVEYEEELFQVSSSQRKVSWNWRYLAMAGIALGGVAIAVSLIVTRGDSSSPATPAEQQPPPAATEPPKGEELLGGGSPEPTRSGASPTPTATATETPEGAFSTRNLANAAPPQKEAFLLSTPLRGGSRVIDLYGEPRGEGMIHAGMDLVARDGGKPNVITACSGRVVGSDRTAGYGLFVVVDCGFGLRTVYAGMAEVSVEAGDQVVIAETELGVAEEVLHFELRSNGIPVDPLPYFDPIAPPGTPTPSPTPTATPEPETPTPTPEPGGGGTGGDEPDEPSEPTEPTATPTASPTPTNTPTPSPTPTVTPVPPTPTPTPRPVIR